MYMTNIFNELMQSIETGAYPYFFETAEYRKEQNCMHKHLQWLEEHLNEEEKTHLEQLRSAELNVSNLECEAQVKVALAVGIRLALPR